MTDRLLAISTKEFEAAIKHLVERKFERARQRGARKMPITGDEIYYDDAPSEHYAQLVRRATKALIARKWFAECESPPWALALGGLPLSQDEIVSLLNDHDRGDYRPRCWQDTVRPCAAWVGS